ncbi:MAG: hypothetical protein FWG31_09315 [Oscillospiraceae bacterium]|nr:hypothetical protein [Oscillospiraceae bacterium]
MRKNRAFLTIAAIGGILILLTTIAFFLMEIEERNRIYWSGYWFLIFSELVFCGGLMLLPKMRSFFTRAGVVIILALYLGGTLIVSLSAGNFERVNLYILLHIAVIGVFAILAVLLFSFMGKMGDGGRGGTAGFPTKGYENRIQAMTDNSLNHAYSSRLNKLLKGVKSSGSVPGSFGDDLTALENALREGAGESIIQDIIDKLLAVVK